MAGNITGNQGPVIKAQVFSEIMLSLLHDDLLPTGLSHDVSDFGDGEQLFIPVMGDVVIRDYTEDQAILFDPIDTGQVSLRIQEYKTSNTYFTDKLKQDGYKVAELEAQFPVEAMRKIREAWESDMLALQGEQVLNDPNLINGIPHRISGSGVGGIIDVNDFVVMKTAFDKADMPYEGRVAIVDPLVESIINSFVGQQGFINNPMFEGLVTEGFSKNHKFVRNIFGWDIWTSNRLSNIDNETLNNANGAPITFTPADPGVANVFMSVIDNDHKPFMNAWRETPNVEGFRNINRKRDEYSVSARYGHGLKRAQGLGVVVSNATQILP